MNCEFCGAREGSFVKHHWSHGYRNMRLPETIDLCVGCHRQYHKVCPPEASPVWLALSRVVWSTPEHQHMRDMNRPEHMRLRYHLDTRASSLEFYRREAHSLGDCRLCFSDGDRLRKVKHLRSDFLDTF